MSWKLSRTVLRGGAIGNGGSLLGRKVGKGRVPYYVRMANNEPMPFAGLWESWQSPEGQHIETCAILTTEANAVVAKLHDRIPVILPPEAFNAWLDPNLHNPETLSSLLTPAHLKRS